MQKADTETETPRVAILGHGAVARYLAEALGPDAVAAVVSRPGREDAARRAMGPVLVVSDLADLPKGLDCVVDCAGHSGLRSHGAKILAAGVDLVTVSIGALADDGLSDELSEAALSGQSRLTLATGAIGALDALSAAAAGGLDTVTYLGRKPPAGWRGSPAEEILDLDRLTSPEVHFEGTARDCARAYPKNANVAAAVALAGLGFDQTQARLIADPGIDRNIHEIEASGRFGRFHFTIEGRGLPDNPKSSALTAMSLVQAVTRRSRRLRF